jgi:hypothetical protein
MIGLNKSNIIYSYNTWQRSNNRETLEDCGSRKKCSTKSVNVIIGLSKTTRETALTAAASSLVCSLAL